MSKHHNLIESWRRCNLESPPYLFPDDEKHLSDFPDSKTYHSFDEYVVSPEFGVSDINLHLGLLPIPFPLQATLKKHQSLFSCSTLAYPQVIILQNNESQNLEMHIFAVCVRKMAMMTAVIRMND